MKHEKTVFRQIAFPLSAFDYLKHFQREHVARTGRRLTNNEALALLLEQHEALTEERGERNRVGTKSTQGT